LTKRDEQATKADAAGTSGAQSRTKRRAGAERKQASSPAKQTRDIIDISRSEEERAVFRSVSGSDNDNFTLNLVSQVVAAQWRENASSDERQTDATLAAMSDLKPRDPIEGMTIGQAMSGDVDPVMITLDSWSTASQLKLYTNASALSRRG
jgi:hypothetical protein